MATSLKQSKSYAATSIFCRVICAIGGSASERDNRLAMVRELAYNDLSADRQVVAAVEAMEAILSRHAGGEPECVASVNDAAGGLVLRSSRGESDVLYKPDV